MKKELNIKCPARLKHSKPKKNTIIYGAMLLTCCTVLSVFELTQCHHILGISSLELWQKIVSPLGNEIKNNFINLYISQISTTFLVTAFLSILGDKDSPIYWTSAMEHKLVHPVGSSLKDLASYSFLTLGVSFLSLILKARLCFTFSFLLNIWLLIIMTRRMIDAFYNRDKIKKELIEQFRQKDASDQEHDLITMEENMVRAAQLHDIEYLRECMDFFKEIAPNEDLIQLKQLESKILELISQSKTFEEKCSEYLECETKTIEAGNKLGASISQQLKDVANQLKANFIDAYDLYQLNEIFTSQKISDFSCWNIPNYIKSDDIAEITKQIRLLGKKAKQVTSTSKNPLWVHIARKIILKIDNNDFSTRLLRCITVIPTQFAELQFNSMQEYCNRIGISNGNSIAPESRTNSRIADLEQSMNESNNLFYFEPSTSFTLREKITLLLRKNLRDGSLLEDISSQGLNLLIDLELYELKLYFNSEVRYSICDGDLDFKAFFTHFTSLLIEAYNNNRSLNPYAKAIVDVCALIEHGLWKAYILNNPTPASEKDAKMKEIFKRVRFFSEEDIKKISSCICSDTALYNDHQSIYEVLRFVCMTAHNISDETKNEIENHINQSIHLGEDRGFILTFLQ